jgi:flavodoxin I
MGLYIDTEVKRPRFGVVTAGDLCNCDLLIVGSPTQQGKALSSITILLDAIPEDGLKNTRVAAFDTRHKWKWVKVWGYAAPHIAEMLKAKGGRLIAPPEGFIVNTTKGPVRNGEMERAKEWAKSLLDK